MTSLVHFEFIYEVSPIDFFDLAFTSEELVSRLEKAYEDGFVGGHGLGKDKNYIRDQISKLTIEIRKACLTKLGEAPHTIRWFAIPEPEQFSFSFGAVAKISNNGTCLVFCERELKYLESSAFTITKHGLDFTAN